MEKRNEIRETLPYLYELCDFEGDIYKVAEKIRTIPETYIERYKDHTGMKDMIDSLHRFDINTKTDYEGYVELNICGYRWETDEEFKKRKATNAKKSKAAKLSAKTKQENLAKKELEEYERLKLKFKNK